ncbi:hypothetical protein MKX03_020392 [Papaver bracteatum]|nr:hypothetical protein MKX03_020392 [Papaver bracteatum]
MASLLMYSSLVLVYVLFSSTEAADILKFDAQKDSVLKVGREDYVNCNVTKSIAEYRNGIGCERGNKLVVVVMSRFHNGIAPGPSPMGSAVAPSSGSHSLKTGSFLGALLVVALFFCAY